MSEVKVYKRDTGGSRETIWVLSGVSNAVVTLLEGHRPPMWYIGSVSIHGEYSRSSLYGLSTTDMSAIFRLIHNAVQMVAAPYDRASLPDWNVEAGRSLYISSGR